MATNDYTFVTRWQVTGTCEQVYDILIHAESYPRWWPEVYLQVETIAPGSEHGLGKAARLITKGKLPYRLRWQMLVTEVRYPFGFTLQATGDFVGQGVWQFQTGGALTHIIFDWRLRAEKPLLRYLSFAFKPIFAANHRWAMARGEEGLRRELSRTLPRGDVTTREAIHD